jgi:hypothetical protein
VIGFPALVDEGDTVALRVQDTPEKAAAAHRKGLRRLFALELREQVKFVEKSLPRELGLLFMPWGTEAELKGQIVAATLERTCMLEPLPADAAAFAKRKDEARARISLVGQEIARLVGRYSRSTPRCKRSWRRSRRSRPWRKTSRPSAPNCCRRALSKRCRSSAWRISRAT